MRALSVVIFAALCGTATAQPHWRPLLHFSPARNWINDPNGLVYYDGEYHLFFQYNPFGDGWGHMSWGHAVSRDLTTWQELPVALAEQNGIAIFSGSAVVDARNTSGFGTAGVPPLVAIYTGHSRNLQTQNIAYSNDRGRTWTKYAGNPVIDIKEADFRDPMVFWHGPSARWVMVVALAKQHKVRFYASPDLKKWQALSDFGPAGVQNVPNWECPSLFSMRVAGREKWVLVIGVGDGAVGGGSGTQYFTGDFDGVRFVNDNPVDRVLWLDHGPDFYAAQTWSDVPARDGRRIVAAWMSNWKYADKVPTNPWRGQMSYPRTLELRRTGGGIRLFQNPVRELERYRAGSLRIRGKSLREAAAVLDRDWAEVLDMSLTLQARRAVDAGIELRKGGGKATRVGYDARRKVVYVDRTNSGETEFHGAFAGRYEAPLEVPGGAPVNLRILLDRNSVEVFADGGRVALTALIFPDGAARRMALYSTGERAGPVSLEIHEVRDSAVAPGRSK